MLVLVSAKNSFLEIYLHTLIVQNRKNDNQKSKYEISIVDKFKVSNQKNNLN